MPSELGQEAENVLRDLNAWWKDGRVRPQPPPYRRPAVRALAERVGRPQGRLVEVVRGPRQVGKTTGLHQVIEELIRSGAHPEDVLFIRFDLELLREERAALRRIVRWYAAEIRKRALEEGAPAVILLDEVHKLPRWSDEVKHLVDTFPVRVLLTGSSSVLVARGGRESLAGRVFTTELPPFSFREVLECWKPALAEMLPPRITLVDVFDGRLADWSRGFNELRPQQKLSLRRSLERYYARGGYPRLHSGDVEDDRWADYIVQTIFENVLGADIPDLFPVEQPRLLRALYLELARHACKEVSQNSLTEALNVGGFRTNQPTVGRYLHYLADALLIREFRRYPLAKKASARVPAKLSLVDLGIRNAILRSTPSLWESDPTEMGPLVETLVQSCLRGPNLQTHFFRDFENPRNRSSPIREVDFVVERIDGGLLPIEVKFRRRLDEADTIGLRHFHARFGSKVGVVVTRETSWSDELRRMLALPLESFLLAF
ncbi:MAG TPA: ATP-binding protein [Polyangiaceae bacterium]|nr:ATP-binding protein [Polyangiaceae bacterium]